MIYAVPTMVGEIQTNVVTMFNPATKIQFQIYIFFISSTPVTFVAPYEAGVGRVEK